METPTTLTARLLVPLDGSEFAEQALAYALAMETPDTQIVLAQVLPEPGPGYETSAEMTAAKTALEHRASKWGLAPERVRITVRMGDPAENLLDVATTQQCTLVVLASHGRNAVGLWRFGSVASRLARSAPIPVLIVRPDSTVAEPGTPASIERILVPLDGSPRAERALPLAGALARQLGLAIHLVRVVPSPETPDVPIVGPAGVGAPVLPQLHAHEEDPIAAAWTYLEEISSHAGLAGVETVPDVPEGSAVPCLLEMTSPTDLVVLTSRGRGEAARWLLGSVADKLVREAAAPVCLVPNAQRLATVSVPAEEIPGTSVHELLLREVYSPREAAELVGTDVATICQAAFKGELPANIINHDVVSIRRQDLVAWLNRR